MVSRNIFLKP